MCGIQFPFIEFGNRKHGGRENKANFSLGFMVASLALHYRNSLLNMVGNEGCIERFMDRC